MEDYLEGLVRDREHLGAELKRSTYIEMAHGITVSNLVSTLAEELGESSDFCEKMAIAGLFHDVGKLQVSKYLYSDGREDALAIEQIKYVRMHPTHSFHALVRNGYADDIATAVYSHHENFDGSGYPDNLRGEKIPWMARILRTCDVFSALTSDRSYRSAFDPKTAMEIMIDEVADYDMQVFLAFQRLLHSDHFPGMEHLHQDITPLHKKHLPLFVREAERIQ